MQLKARVDDCLTNKCDPLKVKAEAIAQRLGLDVNRDGPPSAKDHISSPDKLIETRTWSVNDIIDYH